MIDVALYEAVFNCMESLLPEYSAFGAVRGPAGSALPGIAPTNAYRCSDGGYVLIAGNGDSIFRRLMAAIGRDDLANDPALADNAGRVARVDEIDAAIGAWTAQRTRRRGAGGAGRAPTCRPAASTPWPTSPPTRTTARAACCSRCRMDDGSALDGAGHRAQAVAHARRPPPQRARAWARTPTPCCASSA